MSTRLPSPGLTQSAPRTLGKDAGDDGYPAAPLGCPTHPAPPLTVTRQPHPPGQSRHVADICMQYGLDPRPASLAILRDFRFPLPRRSIILISGPSGSGKTSILQAIRDRVDSTHTVDDQVLHPEKPVIDNFEDAELDVIQGLLTACALGEPRLWLRRTAELSEGERFRARLATAIHRLARIGSHRGTLLCDEFGSTLHRRAARSVAYGLRKLTTRLGLTVVLACRDDDLVADLQPDRHLRLGPAQPYLKHLTPRRKAFSLRRGVRIEPGTKADYAPFKAMHYRDGDELGFVDQVFVLRERPGREVLGVVVYAYPPLELSLRNRVFEGRYCRNYRRLNREVRILRRLVVHPDVRGCGLGHYLVRQTLSRLGVPYVECLSSLGHSNPVFEKAGMRRIGECALSRRQIKTRRALQAIGVDPFADDFPKQVRRRSAVRDLVTATVTAWYQATSSAAAARAGRQSPEFLARTFRSLIGSRPVYYLWQQDV